ncbi:Hsp20/alpha crystallin family protein [Actinoplanes sp. NPDC051633]|uniref:Hsp20/alpha crystallin family protein n=1 Tax=Actinoplanes sp. NPDC051633 TaxID=3155670 RepID=UPI0034259892
MFLRYSEPEQLTARVVGTTRAAGCRVETYRDGETFHIDIDLPGMDPADIDVSVDDNVMTVRAARHSGGDEPQSPAQDYAKQVRLSDRLDTDRLDARYDDGALTISIPVRTTDLARAA